MVKLSLKIRMVTLYTTCFNKLKRLIELPKYSSMYSFSGTKNNVTRRIAKRVLDNVACIGVARQ
jgi:hypothetical protein